MSITRKLVFVFVLGLSISMLMAGVALAAGDKIPHGGYEENHGGVDTSTDACLQCHDVHEAGSDYVLLRWTTVLATCGSCHYLYGDPAGTTPYPYDDPSASGGSFGQGVYATSQPLAGTDLAYDPGYDDAGTDGNRVELDSSGYLDAEDGFAPLTNSIGSRISAYEVRDDQAENHNGHRLQMGASAEAALGGGLYVFADGETKDANYIPGGSNTLTAIKEAAYPAKVDVTSFAGTNGLYCASCHTPHGNFGQQLLVTGTSDTPATRKLLSGAPNHSSNISIASWGTEANLWCEKCHDKRKSVAGSSTHNHPSSFCTTCHANSTDDPTGDGGDFPHTGLNPNLLSKEPDALCVSCHKKGWLP